LAHRDAAVARDSVLASIAAYYRRDTTDASPMGRLVSAAMLVLSGAAASYVSGNDASPPATAGTRRTRTRPGHCRTSPTPRPLGAIARFEIDGAESNLNRAGALARRSSS